ncbi:MAG: phosphotransferase [Gemmatimonadota bacterium]|nr:phosphotransferase [Gemmatimonadota bacterium]
MNRSASAPAYGTSCELPEAVSLSRDPKAVAPWVLEHMLRPGHTLRSLQPVYSRYKGEDGGLVTYRLDVEGGQGRETTYVTVRTGPRWRLESQAERFLDPAHQGRPGPLDPVHVDLNVGVLLVAFPLDRAMRDLRRAIRVKWVRRWLESAGILSRQGSRLSRRRSRVHILSYRPERRAVLRLDGRLEDDTEVQAYLRLQADPNVARRSWAAGRALGRAGLPGPRPLGRPRPELVVESAVPGRPRPPGSVSSDSLRALGALLARIHDVEAPEDLKPTTGEAVRVAATRCVEDLIPLHADLGTRAMHCLRELGQGPTGNAGALLHGDLHFGQVLFDSDQPALVDWDRSSGGNPSEDLGTLHAHLLARHATLAEESMNQVLAGYEAQGGVLRTDEVRWYRGHALLRLVNMPYRALRSDWEGQTAEILGWAEADVPC